MAKLPWLIAIALAGCASNTDAPSGTYAITLSGQTCNENPEQTITFANSVITVGFGTAYSVPTATSTNVETSSAGISFDIQFSATDVATGDTANGTENYMLTYDGTTLSGTLDGMYNGMRGGVAFGCASLLGVDGTRAAK